jgi:hypothetical protein
VWWTFRRHVPKHLAEARRVAEARYARSQVFKPEG